MRLLVTGGCGFVGANLVHCAQAAGHAVRVFDSEILGKRAHLGAFTGEFVRGDIRDPAAIRAALAGIDAVVHLAADTRVIESIADPALNVDVNIIGSFTLLEAMREVGVRRIVNASTGGAIMGEVEPPVHEEMVPCPVSPYGATKLAVEGLCSAYAGSYGFVAQSLRFSNVYGPRSFHKGSVVAAFFKAILLGQTLVVYGDGEQTRDFVYAGDLCDGILRAIASDVPGVLQLGSGVPVSVNALIDAMREVVAPLPVTVEYRPARAGEISRTWCAIDRARAAIGYDPRTSLAVGLAATWGWFAERQKAA